MATPPLMIYPDGTQTTVSPTPPDVTYIRTREDLLQYEDARFNSLIQATPNYYIVENDQSLWGDILRAVSQELARLEYDYAYDIVNKQPIYLTPPDIKRRFAAPLYINRLYPTSDPVQYDLAYKMMLVDLIPAYGMGATVASLEAIITAYTGLEIQVLELYKFVGQGFFDQSDRNALSVSVNVGGDNPLDDITQLNQLQAITNALYGAIDLGKPAHVGLEFKTVFGTNEDIASFVSEGTSDYYGTVNPNGITDKLRIIILIVEAEPFNPMLWQAPDLLSATPKTGLGPSQVLAWTPSTAYSVGQMILGSGGFFQVVTTAGTSGPAQPTFNPTVGGTTTDGLVLVWTNAGAATGVILYPVTATHNPDVAFSVFQTIVDPNQFVQVVSLIYSMARQNTHAYTVGQTILDTNGNIQIVTVPGTSGAINPAWNATVGGLTAGDGTVTWKNLGPPASYHSWIQSHSYAVGEQIIDANGYIQTVVTAGTSGESDISNLYYPPFDEIIGQHTADGTVVWQTTSLYTWNTSLGGITQDAQITWVNIGPPPGLVAPRISKTWEVKGDQLTTFETS